MVTIWLQIGQVSTRGFSASISDACSGQHHSLVNVNTRLHGNALALMTAWFIQSGIFRDQGICCNVFPDSLFHWLRSIIFERKNLEYASIQVETLQILIIFIIWVAKLEWVFFFDWPKLMYLDYSIHSLQYLS